MNRIHLGSPLSILASRRASARLRRLALGAAVAVSLVACGDDGGNPSGDGPTPGSATMSGVVTSQVDGSPVVGATICVVEMPDADCAETDATGAYTLTQLPDATRIHARFAATGYVPMNWSHDTARSGDTASPAIVPVSVATPLLAAAGATFDDQTAILLVKAVDDAIAGRPGIVMAAELGAGAMGPVYLSPAGVPDTALTSTSTAGVAAFAQVAPGAYSVRYVAPEAVTCAPRWGWAGEGNSSMEVLAVGGQMTFVEMLCAGEAAPVTGDVSLQGAVQSQVTSAPIEGVMVCVAELPEHPCAETNAAGLYQLDGLPNTGHFHVRYDAESYIPLNWAIDTATAETSFSVRLVPSAVIDALLAPVGAEFGDDTGVVLAKAVDTDIEPLADVLLAGDLGDGAVGPLYLSESAVPDPSLSATSAYGIGGWAEVAPGTYTVTYDAGDGVACAPRWGWSGGAERTIEVNVVAGEMTAIEMLCD